MFSLFLLFLSGLASSLSFPVVVSPFETINQSELANLNQPITNHFDFKYQQYDMLVKLPTLPMQYHLPNTSSVVY
jgi:hypothetical protein